MFLLPNGKRIDLDMLETAMQDADLGNHYFLNTQTGEVTFFSDLYDAPGEREEEWEAIEGSDDYVAIDRIPSHEAYQWMEDFVEQMVAPEDRLAAEKVSIALMGKVAFRRFKDVLHLTGEKWGEAWYQWRDDRLHEAVKEWLESLPVHITEELPEKHT